MIACVEHEHCLGVEQDPRHFGEQTNLYNPFDTLRHAFDGVATLAELGAAVEAVGAKLCVLAERGWEIDAPVRDGLITMHWTKPGPPPPEDSGQVDGCQAHERTGALNSG